MAQAQTEAMSAALGELSEIYGSPVVRVDQARAICDQEQYIVECAKIGKKYDLFSEEREREVDVLLTQFKSDVVTEFKQCESTECLIGVATRIARELSKANPGLARTIDLTPERVSEKRAIIDVAKTIGVNIDECRTMDPDTASVDLLRACAKLAKHDTIRRYIPEESRANVEKTESTAALKEALERGEIACGDGTIEGCGKFCLNPGSGTQGGAATIPPVCRQIAERFFGNEGVRELDNAYQRVRYTYDEAQIIYTEEYRNRLREGTTTPNTLLCPNIINYPCPPGQYRQESVNELGCFALSACIPFNTNTLPELKDKGVQQVTCPALPTVSACSSGEERVATYSSPACGTYYACRPKVENRPTVFPFTFKSGRTVSSFEEGRVYCYESGTNGATARGDREDCSRVLHITVPEIPPEKQCAGYGTGWHSMDQSGNCFNESMTEYRTPGGALQQCSTAFVYGCTSNYNVPVPSGQKEQVWNTLGLRSWIRSDASASRISELKAACANVSSNANIWLSGAGTQSSADFGMPDAEKCRKASSCTSAQYWDGGACVTATTATTTWPWTGYGTTTPGEYKGDATSCPGFAYSRWDQRGARYCQLNNRTSCQYFYPQYLTESNYSPASCPAEQSTGTVSGSCSTELLNLLGSGCHSMGNAWFNSAMTSYVMPGGTAVRSCTTEPISGCSGTTNTSSCPSGQYWSGTSCVPSTTSTGTGGYGSCGSYTSQSSCTSVANCYWYSGSSSYCYYQSGNSSSCPSGQYWSGTSCVTSSGGYEGPSGSALCSDGIDNDADGLIDNADSSCQYSSTTTGTTGGYEGPYGSSLCSDGIDNDADGLIDSADTSCQSSSSATCSSGQYWNGSSCVSTTSTSCPSGQYWNGSACVNTSTTDCASGQYWNGSTCVSSQTSSSCSSGQYWDGSACVSSQTNTTTSPDYSSQQSSCSAAGGTWDSASNYCRMP
ncbi:MAG: hypothetical protein HYT46_00975, partial [Candidatus Vogelbacteria bacterium]|nr:hypothetical protein [Candidatus Vogelbacteria bacterium]